MTALARLPLPPGRARDTGVVPVDIAPTGLPVEDCVPDLRRALGGAGQAVLVAPPGAGKTTVVPLASSASHG